MKNQSLMVVLMGAGISLSVSDVNAQTVGFDDLKDCQTMTVSNQASFMHENFKNSICVNGSCK